MTTESKKICQERMVQCNKKPGDFQQRKGLLDNKFPLVRMINMK